MDNTKKNWEKSEHLLEEIVELQKKKLFTLGRGIVPNLTAEDILQPNDYLELENNPVFRHEEGILIGTQSVQIALKALRRELDASYEI